jgi:hypothetical protein
MIGGIFFTRSTDADTNNYKRVICNTNETYGTVVRKYLKKLNEFDINYTYVFELCTLLVHITRYNKEFICLLAAIDKRTDLEVSDEFLDLFAFVHEVERPKYFKPMSITDVQNTINTKSKDVE